MKREVKIVPPPGFQIDEDNSTLETIVFKLVEKKKNRDWKDLPIELTGAWVNNTSRVTEASNFKVELVHRNVWPTKELAEASLAMSQLMQWRKAYLLEADYRDWQPDFSDNMKSCWCILSQRQNFVCNEVYTISAPLSFPGRKMGNRFIEEFRDLLEIAKPLV